MNASNLIAHRSLLAALVSGAAFLAACGGGASTPEAAQMSNASAVSLPTPAPNDVVGPAPTADDSSLQAADTSADAERMQVMAAKNVEAAGTGVVNLTWRAPKGTVASYRVYYGSTSRAYAQKLGSGLQSSTTSLSVSGLAAGTYYFSVTAVDSTGHETAYSDETVKLVS